MIKASLILIFIVLLLSSCASKKAIYESSSSSDYNLRKTYQKPQYKYKVNMIGWSAAIGAAALGGYYGYKSNFYYFKTNEVKKSPIMDACFGAFLGFGIIHLGNYIFAKKGQIVPLDYHHLNEYDWVKNLNRNEILLSFNNGRLESIHKKAIESYSFKTLNDAYDFKKAFPQNVNYNDILARDHSNLNRDDLPKLISLFPDYENITELKIRYLSESNDVISLLQAENMFPNTDFEIEKKAAMLTSSFNDLQVFNDRFPKSSFTKKLIEKNFNSYSHNELGNLIEEFPLYSNNEIKKRYILSSSSIKELLGTAEKFEEVISKQELMNAAFHLIESRKSAKVFYDNFKNSSYVNRIVSAFPSYSQSYMFDTYFIGPTDKNRKANGYGYVIGLMDNIFFAKGEFRHGKPHGQIKLIDDNYSFEGQYLDGKRNGRGKLDWGDYSYEGEWKNGLKWGYGTAKYKDNDGIIFTDRGNYYEGDLHGEAKRSCSDGSWVKGNFKNGEPHGELLEYRTTNGYRIKGKWVEGYPVGTHNVEKWTLFGILDTYEGTVTYGDEGEIVSQTTVFDIWASSTASNSINNEKMYEIVEGYAKVTIESTDYYNIFITTGGILGHGVCPKTFSATLVSNSDHVEESQNYIDCSFTLIDDEFFYPITLFISYQRTCNARMETVKIIIFEPAFYSIDITK